MEAALKAATEAFASAGQAEGAKALHAATVAMYVTGSNTPHAEAAKMSSEAYTAAKRISAKPEEFPLPAPKADTEAEKLLKGVAALTKANVAEATQTAKDVLAIVQKSGDKIGEAAALNLIANAYLVNGEPVSAVRAARQALSIFLSTDNKAAELPILETLLSANLVKKDLDEALRAAKEIAKLAMFLGKKKSAAYALGTVAEVLLVSGSPGGAVKVAEEAAGIALAEGDKEGQAAALSIVYKVHRLLGKPASAAKAATQVAKLVQGKKGAEAAASLMLGDANPASKASLEASKRAVELFREAGDKGGEASALVALANACVLQAQKQVGEAQTSAQGAMTLFSEKGDKTGKALAASTLAMVAMMKEDPVETEKAAKEAVTVAKEAGNSLAESYANSLLCQAPFTGLVQTPARLLFDDSYTAIVECSDLSTQDSLEAIVQTLHNWSGRGRGVKAISVCIEGRPCPQSLQCTAVRSGAFLLGIRSTGFPVAGSICGKVSGPAWGMLMCCDYRIASQDAEFLLPVWGPPECLPDMVGQSVATHLCLSHGPASALSMLEMGVLHQVQPNKDAAQKAATEFSKRVANFPGIAMRQTMCLMSPDVEKYALSFAKWGQ